MYIAVAPQHCYNNCWKYTNLKIIFLALDQTIHQQTVDDHDDDGLNNTPGKCRSLSNGTPSANLPPATKCRSSSNGTQNSSEASGCRMSQETELTEIDSSISVDGEDDVDISVFRYYYEPLAINGCV